MPADAALVGAVRRIPVTSDAAAMEPAFEAAARADAVAEEAERGGCAPRAGGRRWCARSSSGDEPPADELPAIDGR